MNKSNDYSLKIFVMPTFYFILRKDVEQIFCELFLFFFWALVSNPHQLFGKKN